MCKSEAPITDNIKVVSFNVFLTVHFVTENIFSQRRGNGHYIVPVLDEQQHKQVSH